MGRAARHIKGEVIMYAGRVTGSMKRAIDEVGRRRDIQLEYNKTHGITPLSISKPIRDKLIEEIEEVDDPVLGKRKHLRTVADRLLIKTESLTPQDKNRLTKTLEKEMRTAAGELNFELAARIRDRVRELKSS